MTLETYIANLTVFAKENPKALKLEVVTSIDDEGNGYNPVVYTPSYVDDESTNTVCVN